LAVERLDLAAKSQLRYGALMSAAAKFAATFAAQNHRLSRKVRCDNILGSPAAPNRPAAYADQSPASLIFSVSGFASCR